jgi:hypothetical protein
MAHPVSPTYPAPSLKSRSREPHQNISGQTNRRSKQSPVAVNENVAKLRYLIQGLDAESYPKNLTARNRQQRLVKLRAGITKIAKDEARKLCNCRTMTVATGVHPEEFEAEMNAVCPIHVPRRLGIIATLWSCYRDDPGNFRLKQLLREYRSRCCLSDSGG